MSSQPRLTRKIFIVCHGEQVDLTFGNWISASFDESGTYVRRDLNMPLELPYRQGSPNSFNQDGPLTMIGEAQAKILGQGLRLAGVEGIRHVFCSPSLSCLQTCQNLLKSLQEEGEENTRLKIAVEPGLFDWNANYQDSMPQFLTKDEMKLAGFNVEEDYDHIVQLNYLTDQKETEREYYIRSHYVVQKILQKISHLNGDVLLVGYSGSLDACSRQLITQSVPTMSEMCWLSVRHPYCSLLVVQEDEKGSWNLVEPPVPALTHSWNEGYYGWKHIENPPPVWRTWNISKCFGFVFRIFKKPKLIGKK